MFLFSVAMSCSHLQQEDFNQDFVEQLHRREEQSKESIKIRRLQKEKILQTAENVWHDDTLQECFVVSSPKCVERFRSFVSQFEFAMVTLPYRSQSTAIRSAYVSIPFVSMAKNWLAEYDSEWREEKVVQGRYGMKRIPSDIFVMGCQPGDAHCSEDELPAHVVTISHDFYLGKTEVTQEFFSFIQKSNPSRFQFCGSHCPVESVSFYEATRFLNSLSQKEGLENCYIGREPNVSFVGVQCTGYRLPTEAEWEYAARGGESFLYAGSSQVDEVAWHKGNAGDTTHPIAQKKPNRFGLFDMSGNVLEWCNDWYWSYSTKAQTDPVRKDRTKSKVGRGGAWFEDALKARNSDRYFEDPSFQYDLLGFRIAQTIIPTE